MSICVRCCRFALGFGLALAMSAWLASGARASGFTAYVLGDRSVTPFATATNTAEPA
jgi:hypothetical protein